jgi:hypothetical protein
MLPSPEDKIQALDKIVKAFGDRVQVELIKARWEENKKLQSKNLPARTVFDALLKIPVQVWDY